MTASSSPLTQLLVLRVPSLTLASQSAMLASLAAAGGCSDHAKNGRSCCKPISEALSSSVDSSADVTLWRESSDQKLPSIDPSGGLWAATLSPVMNIGGCQSSGELASCVAFCLLRVNFNAVVGVLDSISSLP